MRRSSTRLTLEPVNRSPTAWTMVLPSFSASALLLDRSQDAVDDALVSGASADVAGEGLSDLGLSCAGVLAQQLGRLHQEAGRAKAALEAVRFPHCILQRIERAVDREPFDRGHLGAV